MKTQIIRNSAFCAIGVLRHARCRGSTAAGLLLAAGALGVLAPAPAVADDVAAGIDVWSTPEGSEATVTVPADFFGAGSDPFVDLVIEVEGLPFFGQDFDTVIERLDDAVLSGCPAEATIGVEIAALSLVSSAPITVTFNGGQDPEEYDVSVCLSDCYQNQQDGFCDDGTPCDVDPDCTTHTLCAGGSRDAQQCCPDGGECQGGTCVGGSRDAEECCPDAGTCPAASCTLCPVPLSGTMTIHHNCTAGGTFDSSFPVYAKFTFTPVGGGADVIFDPGREGALPEMIETGQEPGRWVHVADPGFGISPVGAGLVVDGNCDGVADAPLPGTSNFVSGIGSASCTCPAAGEARATGDPVQCGFLTFEGAHNVRTGKTAAITQVGCCLDDGWCVKKGTNLECYDQGSSLYILEADACRKPDLCLLNGNWEKMDPACCECRGGVHHLAKTGLTALLLGNTDYDPTCVPDLPGVIGDVLNKQNALDNAGWSTVVAPNQSAADMADAISKHLPPILKDPEASKYIVWYAGHGKAPDGALVGTDCVNLTPQDLIDSLGSSWVEDTLVILDSCLGGDFANAANALAGPEPNGLGFITAGGKGQCVAEDEQKGLFSRCFVEGLNGAADAGDTGEGLGRITVAEAAAYAIGNCNFPTPQTPTWDGDHGDWVIGAVKIEKDRVFLDRPVTEPDADPEFPITDPTGSWHELYPKFSSDWNCLDWTDDNGSAELDKADYLLMERKDTLDTQWYRVQHATVTIEVTQKECLCSVGANPCKTDDDCTGGPDVCVCAPVGPVAYLDHTGGGNLGLTDPDSAPWHEVYPQWSRAYNVVAWDDTNEDQRLSSSDQIQLVEKDNPTNDRWYHIERVSWDIEIAPEGFVKELCNKTGTNAGCWAGCLPEACDADCNELPENLVLLPETNFMPVHLALIQAGNKINRFQEAVHEILLKQYPPPKKIMKVANVQDAAKAILEDYKKQGPGHVVIFGHGSPGHFKIGEDDLAHPLIQGKFVNMLKGKLKKKQVALKQLTLYGCEVGSGAEGQAFLKKLTGGLQRPVHTWTGKVYAFPNKWPDGTPVPDHLANRFFREADEDKKQIPAVTPLGMVVMAVLVLAAGAVVIKRARAVRVQG